MNAVIACGGTGGHLFPGLAVAEVLRARGHEVMLFISEKEIDTLALSGQSEFRFERLPTVGLPSPFSPAIFRFTQRFNESLSRCRRIYRSFNPHVVLGMGGFTSTAPVLAGRMRRHPDFHSRIERDSRQSEPPDRAHGARRFARVQRMRAIFPEGAHGSYRHADPRRTQTDRSRGGARETRIARRSAHAARHGRQPGRELASIRR